MRTVAAWMKGGRRVVTKLTLHKGIWVRDTSRDWRIIDEDCYGWLDVRGKVCLDIGAYIGHISRRWMFAGAKRVVSYEPDADNFVMLELNSIDSENYMAGIASEEKEGSIWIPNEGRNPASITSLEADDCTEAMAHFESFLKVLEDNKPEVVKIDCEGAEYEFMRDVRIPDCVRQLAIEFHVSRPHHKADIEDISNKFRDWELVKALKFRSRDQSTCGWRR